LEWEVKNKLKRFKENESFQNVIQPDRDALVSDQFSLKGKWKTNFFKNDSPLVLELGCGKGEYTVHLAQNDSERNYLGIDIKGARFWRGSKNSFRIRVE
jgi:tRNA (guanine-N7-)-methyltransferase